MIHGPHRSVPAGVRVDGIFSELLRHEREHHERFRVVCADPKNPSGGVFRRPTFLLEPLEAGEPVIVAAWQLSSWHVKVPELASSSAPGVQVAANAIVTVPMTGAEPLELYGVVATGAANVSYLFPG